MPVTYERIDTLSSLIDGLGVVDSELRADDEEIFRQAERRKNYYFKIFSRTGNLLIFLHRLILNENEILPDHIPESDKRLLHKYLSLWKTDL